MGIGADQGIRIDHVIVFRGPHHLGQMFDVDLVADAGSRRNHPKIIKCLLSPAKELITFPVAIKFQFGVELCRILGAEGIDHNRMINDQIDRRQRVYFGRITAQIHHCIAHRRQVRDRRHPGKILHQHPGRAEGDLAVRRSGKKPVGYILYVVGGYGLAVLKADHVFKQYLEAIWQTLYVAQAKRDGGGLEAEIAVIPGICLEGANCFRVVVAGFAHRGFPLSKWPEYIWRLCRDRQGLNHPGRHIKYLQKSAIGMITY